MTIQETQHSEVPPEEHAERILQQVTLENKSHPLTYYEVTHSPMGIMAETQCLGTTWMLWNVTFQNPPSLRPVCLHLPILPAHLGRYQAPRIREEQLRWQFPIAPTHTMFRAMPQEILHLPHEVLQRLLERE
jgi:hypothetical protein